MDVQINIIVPIAMVGRNLNIIIKSSKLNPARWELIAIEEDNVPTIILSKIRGISLLINNFP
jgi:hypothetical protein